MRAREYGIRFPPPMSASGTSERCRRVNLDGRYDGCNELEEHDQIEIDSQPFHLLFTLPRGGGLLLLASAALSAKRPLLLAFFPAGFALSKLLLYHTRIHALDYLLHNACMLARVHRGCLQRGGVWEGFDCDRL